jgi:hypothetical protein
MSGEFCLMLINDKLILNMKTTFVTKTDQIFIYLFIYFTWRDASNANITELSAMVNVEGSSYKFNIDVTKLRDLSPRGSYTDRATAAYRRSYCQFCG